MSLVIAAIVGCSLCIVMGVAIIWTTIYFFRYQKFQFFIQRKPVFLLLSSITACIHVLIHEPLSMLSHGGILRLPPVVRVLVLGVFWLAGIHTFLVVMGMRYWLTLYSYKHAESVKAMDWRKHINAADRDFWTSTTRTWGNPVWVFRVAFCVQLLVTIALIGSKLGGSLEAWFAINTVFIFVIASGSYYAFSSFSSVGFKDKFYLQDELIVILYVFGLNACVCAAINCAAILTQSSLLSIVSSIVSSGMVTVLWLVSSLYVIHLHKSNTAQGFPRPTSSSTPEASSLRTTETFETIRERRHTLLRYIEEQKKFDAFMNHLVQEFSLESLLFIVELMQYKDLFPKTTSAMDEELRRQVDAINAAIVKDRLSYIGLINNGSNHSRSSPRPSASMTVTNNADGGMNATPLGVVTPITKPIILPQDLSEVQRSEIQRSGVSEGESDQDPELRVRLPPSLPVSPEMVQMDAPYERGKYLYNKYIATNSTFELNIPWEMRKQLANFFGDKSVIDSGGGSPTGEGSVPPDLRMRNRGGISTGAGEEMDEIMYLRLVFDDAAREVVDLMLDAFERFRESEEYLRLNFGKNSFEPPSRIGVVE